MSVTLRTRTATPACRPAPRSIWEQLGCMLSLRKERQQLLALDEHLLKDIGITPAEAREEGEKALWDAPVHWHR